MGVRKVKYFKGYGPVFLELGGYGYTIIARIMFFYPHPINKCRLPSTPAAYIQMNLRLDFIKEANALNPGQTAPLGAV